MSTEDHPEIPHGPYCYHSLGPMLHEPDGTPYWKPDYCPHLVPREFNGVTVTWCNFLDAGSVDNGTTDEGYAKLVAHFGSEEALDKACPLFLLWDACKECGVNDD